MSEEIQLLNQETFEMMSSIMEGEFNNLIEVFFSDSRNLVEEIVSLNTLDVHQIDIDSVTRAAHSMKSSSAAIGLDALSALSADFESCFKAGEASEVKARLAEYKDVYINSVKAVKAVQPA